MPRYAKPAAALALTTAAIIGAKKSYNKIRSRRRKRALLRKIKSLSTTAGSIALKANTRLNKVVKAIKGGYKDNDYVHIKGL